MKKILSLMLASFTLLTCFAQNEITLFCKTSEGISMTTPLVINFVKNTAKWGGPETYEILYKTDEWITLFQKDTYKNIGGELAVINRLNGDYKRVAIADFCKDELCKSTRVSNGYYSGTCFQQKF
jgi:hypothetical protein